MSKQLILLGPPGVGVKTQAIALAKRWDVAYLTGDALMDDGKADDGGMQAIRRWLEQPDIMLKGWILGGFPRSLAEAEHFDALLASFDLTADVVYLKAMTGLLINRMVARKAAGETVGSIRKRLADYEAETVPLLAYYEGQRSAEDGARSRLITINASRSVAEVTSELAQLGEEHAGAARFVKDESELDSLIEKEALLVVDCIASWCGPCKLVTPLIDRLAEEYGERVSVVKLDFDSNKQVSKRFGLKGMPSVMFFKAGELSRTLTGVKPYKAYSELLMDLF